ncbi:DUF2586 family protein [Dysgonomonas reticulitermitis]
MALNGLPKVKIDYGNGALGQTISSADGLLCIAVCGAVGVTDTFALAKHYSIRKLTDLEALGVTAENNALFHQTVKHFYTEAPEGTQVFVVGYPSTLKMSDVLSKDNPYLRNVIESTNGQLRGLVVTKVAEATPTITNGLNDDMAAAMLNAQMLGEWSKDARYAPIFTILDGLDFSGDAQELKDLKKHQYNRVGVVIGSTEKGSANQAVGLIAGRIASTSIDTNIGRVANGALNVLTMYAGDTPIELADTESIYNFSYMTFRTFTGISGYFIADDLLATKETDDYNHLTALRTIDKAFRIAYAVLITQLLDKVQVKSNGTMLQPVIVSWQQIVENAITSNMTGELSDDNGDGGVQCYIDPTQDVLATSTINIELRVRPYAYARYINVLLGFTINE